MLDTAVNRPAAARSFAARRRVRLSDLDADGRVRLDAVARFLQDTAIDDVHETGWGAPEHLWVVRRIQIDVVSPLLRDRRLEIETWCSGVAAIAAGRRWSVVGDAGGRAEVDSVWVHLDSRQRPARIGEFGPYSLAAGGRSAATRLELPGPPADAPSVSWALRSTDIDAHGHVNNTVHWQAVEDRLSRDGVRFPAPYRARLEYRDPIDVGDDVQLTGWVDGECRYVAFVVDERVKAVAAVEPLRRP